MPTQLEEFNDLKSRWNTYRISFPVATRYCQLKTDLYQVRNAGWNGNPALATWPPNLVSASDEMLAAVEHYFLCRCWVGSGQFPAWQLHAMNFVYDMGKLMGVTPQHNPNRPVTRLTAMQMAAQLAGIRDGSADLARSGGSAPIVAMPPTY